jgi:hypothetical protein
MRAPALGLFLSIALAPVASRAAFIDAQTFREVSAGPLNDLVVESLTGFGSFDETVTFSDPSCGSAGATQQSTISPHAMFLSGVGNAGFFGCGGASGSSRVVADFELAQGQALVVGGSLFNTIFPITGFAHASFEIRTAQGPVVSFAHFSDGGLALDDVFDLPAGLYTLEIAVSGSAFGFLDAGGFPEGGAASSSAFLEITITPEPATALLLGLGLAALARHRAAGSGSPPVSTRSR